MTTIKSFLPPENPATSPTDITQGRNSGIAVIGAGALTVHLESKVRIANEAGGWTSPVQATYTTAGLSATFIEPQYNRGSRNYGIVVRNDQAGDANRADKIEIVVGAETRIGTEEVPVGRTGVMAHYSNVSAQGDVSIVNRGEIYGYYRGIHVEHKGAGGVTVETAKNSVTSKGIYVNSRKGGDIAITNHGTLVTKRQRPLYAATLTDGANGKVATLFDSTTNEFTFDGITVIHKDTTPATASAITITSSGDITARRRGISVETTGEKGNTIIPVTVDVTGGVLKTSGDSGIRVDTRHHIGGLIKVDLAGEIASTATLGDGIYVYRDSETDPDDPVNRDTKVTLKPAARIGMDGDEPTIGRHGVAIHHIAHGGTIMVTISEGARIGTAGTPVGGHGVFTNVVNSTDEAAITVTNEGFIHAKGSGVAALHRGWGDVVVTHSMGEIVAGDAPDILKLNTLVDSEKTKLADLKGRTAGILAIHGGSEPQAASDETAVDSQAPSTYEAKIGKIEITSKGSVTSKGDGILAYVKDLNDAEGIQGVETIVPIKIDVAGGTIMADGHGVYAETATTYEDEDAPKAGKIEVTVGEMATVKAKKDGVHVKGMRTFASDHARKGQYDQTVTINGKVMGGGGDHAGVRMVNGGTLVVGPKAKVEAASGTAVRSDGRLTITMKKDAVGRIGDVKGKMLNSGTTTFDGVKVGGEYALSPGVETRGVHDVSRVTLKTIEGGHQFEESGRAYHDRARVYEALPSVLLEMSAPGGRQARLSATRDGEGVWARVMASDGEREADMSTTSMDTAGHDLSWDFERWGVETGFVVPTDAPGLTLGVSAHYRDGEADVARGGKIEVSGVGVGASATWRGEDGWYADGEFSYTRFEDIDLSSDARGMVASGLDGEGHAIGVEVGRRMEMDGFALVPRGGLTWTWADIDGFDDVSGVDGSGQVSFRSEDSVRARIGALLENGQTYASLDVEHEFSEDRAVMASGSRLRSEAESTWVRIGVGGVMTLDAKGESTLSGEAHYAVSGGDNHDYGVGALLKVRF